MARLQPNEAREKWQRNLKAASEDIRRGVERVSEAPGVAAARQVDKWANNVADSRDKWRRNVSAVPLEQWRSDMVNKGIGRISAGVDQAGSKMETFYGKLLPYQDSLKTRIDGMPSTSLDDNIQRAVAWMRGMAEFQNG